MARKNQRIANKYLHSTIRRKVHRINSEKGASLSTIDVDEYINDAICAYYENIVQLFETTGQKREELRCFELKKKYYPCKKVDDVCCLMEFPDNYYRLLRQKVIATREGCYEEECEDKNCYDLDDTTDCSCKSQKREIIIRVWQTDDLDEGLQSCFWEPSWLWSEAIGDEGGEGLYVWHNDEFQVEEVCIDYLRRPGLVMSPSLIENNCGPYEDSRTCDIITKDKEIDDFTPESIKKILDIAVLMALRDLGEVRDYQTQYDRILKTDKIHLN